MARPRLVSRNAHGPRTSVATDTLSSLEAERNTIRLWVDAHTITGLWLIVRDDHASACGDSNASARVGGGPRVGAVYGRALRPRTSLKCRCSKGRARANEAFVKAMPDVLTTP